VGINFWISSERRSRAGSIADAATRRTGVDHQAPALRSTQREPGGRAERLPSLDAYAATGE
jgi:hypothetical protein